MVALAKKTSRAHLRALILSSTIGGFHDEMFRPGITMAKPKKVIQLLNDAEVSFVLMGAYALAGWRSQARATQDVDVLVAKKDHAKAVKVISKSFPKLLIDDGVVVTRFKAPDQWRGSDLFNEAGSARLSNGVSPHPLGRGFVPAFPIWKWLRSPSFRLWFLRID